MDTGEKKPVTELSPGDKSVRHQMPVIPTALGSNPRMAISKASAKVYLLFYLDLLWVVILKNNVYKEFHLAKKVKLLFFS